MVRDARYTQLSRTFSFKMVLLYKSSLMIVRCDKYSKIKAFESSAHVHSTFSLSFLKIYKFIFGVYVTLQMWFRLVIKF